MVRPRLILLLAAAALASASTAFSQLVEWSGASSTSSSDPSNWVGGVTPTTDGTQTAEFAYGNNSVMNIDGTANFYGLQVNAEDIQTINGTQLMLGLGAISMTNGGDGVSYTSILTINAPVDILTAQLWRMYNPGGTLTVNGSVSGSDAVQLQGQGSGSTFALNSAASTFGVANNMAGVLFTGNGSYLVVGASSTGAGDAPTSGPLGIGVVQLGDGTSFQTSTTPVIIANTMIFGDATNNFPVILGGQGSNNNPLATTLTFTGSSTLQDATTELDIGPNSTIIFNGSVTGYNTGTNLNFSNIGAGNSLAIVQGNLSNIAQVGIETTTSVIFDGNPMTQLNGVAITTPGTTATYVGVGSGNDGTDGYNQASAVAGFISKLSPANFAGTLGFDNTSGNTGTPFDDPLDISGFTSSNFVGLGSATTATIGIDAVINPPGATPNAQTVYPFGGGGGTLTVLSPLADGTMPRSVDLQAGNAPLTLVLSGVLTYSGGTSVDGGALIFDSAPQPYPVQLGFGATKSGYVGSTMGAYLDTEIGNFIGSINVNPAATGGVVIGFDYIGGTRYVGSEGAVNIDVSSKPSNVYLGTATSVDFNPGDTFTPNGTQYQFSGVKGGFVIVEPALSGLGYSVAVGLPNPMESYSLQQGFVTISSVELSGDNSYTGGTVFNSGYLYVTNDNSLGGGGSGPLYVPDPGFGRSGWIGTLSAINSDVNLPNDIHLGTDGLSVNFGSSQLLTLSGNISDYNVSDHGELGIYGAVELAGTNTYSGSTLLGPGADLIVTNTSSLGSGPLNVYPGTTPILESSGSVTLLNEIFLNSGAVLQLNQYGSSSPLTLIGGVDDLASGGSLVIDGNVVLHGANGYSGGTTLDYALVQVNNAQSLGTGPITITGSPGSTLEAYSTFSLPNDVVVNAPLSLYSGSYEFTLSGQISGAQNITINSPIEFSGNNSAYTGIVLFNAGTLMLSNSNALGPSGAIISSGGALGMNSGITITNPITLNDGGMIAGYGSLVPTTPATYTFQNGSIIAGGGGSSGLFSSGVPKPIPGTLTLGASASLEFGGGGILQFSIDSQFGSVGTDFSLISSAGTLTQTSTSGSPFVIQLIAVDPGTKQQGTPTFNSTLASSWTLISTSGISNFDPTGFTVDTSTFGNGAFNSGSFTVSESGNDLLLNFTPVPEPSTWAMMMSGVCALGAAARRRRRR